MVREGRDNLLRLGTSVFTAAGRESAFYTKGMKPADYLSFYATKFDAVDVDSMYYRVPSVSTVKGWYGKTPKGFLFAAKFPQTITHDKVLQNCRAEVKEFVTRMEGLREKLGALLIQLPYFNRKVFATPAEFNARVETFLKTLPKGRYALETRNKNFLTPDFVDMLREHGVALALTDHPWMPRPMTLAEDFYTIMADFTYIRWLGDRKGIEQRTKVWNKTIVDRTPELREWVEFLRPEHERKIQILAFANNHFAGYAPATVELVRELWDKRP